nr:HlyD family efflux transporter periplasmic adaptor subunit [Allomuricauda sp.]
MKRGFKLLLGLAIVGVGIILFVLMASGKKEPIIEEKSKKMMVSTLLVNPISIPYTVEATGTITAKRKIELYSEVQGILLRTNTEFKEGNLFYKNQNLLQINSEEYRAQLLSNRSAFMNKIAAMLPDMEVEHPEASIKWRSYLESFTIKEDLKELPSPTSDVERFFLTGKGVYESFYNTKNQEERLSKYIIKAPFNGIVTESLVNEGTLVRSGQKLGEFIDPSFFEIKLQIPATANRYIEVGKEVLLQTLDESQEFKGKISRVNAKIDADTQTITTVVELSHKSLKDGQFLKGTIYGEMIPHVVKIENSLLIENNHVYIVKDSILELKQVVPLNYVSDSVVVSGLETNTILVDEKIANAYPGMQVAF